MRREMRKISIVLCLLAMVAVCSSALGGVVDTWASNMDWSTGADWFTEGVGTGTVPGAGDYANVTSVYSGNGIVTITSPAACFQLRAGYYANGTVNVQKDLTVGNIFYVGLVSGIGTVNLNSASGSIVSPYGSIGYTSTGVMNMSAGDATITGAGYLVVGENSNGTLNMSGGNISVDQLYIAQNGGSVGLIDLLGGTINTNYFVFNSGTGQLNLGGSGKLVLTDKYMTIPEWQTYIDSWMAPGANQKIFNAQYNVVGNTIELMAIPEPATLTLLGLGGLLLRRRKA